MRKTLKKRRRCNERGNEFESFRENFYRTKERERERERERGGGGEGGRERVHNLFAILGIERERAERMERAV